MSLVMMRIAVGTRVGTSEDVYIGIYVYDPRHGRMVQVIFQPVLSAATRPM